jgi:HAD superfamily hydrolase (TIGR01490 family)
LPLALFDLDNTLLGGDSDYLWGQFLIETGVVDREHYEAENQRFYDQYKAGVLDIYAFLQFQLRPLAEYDLSTLLRWRDRFLHEKIIPIILPVAVQLIDRHKERGDTPVIVTATNRFITGPIAELFGVEHLLATEPEVRNGRYTGGIDGIPCFRDGKVRRLEVWLEQRRLSLEESWFYTDSHNDLPLLARVTHPVAVDPDDILYRHARRQGWQVISLRHEPLNEPLP